MLDQQLGFGRGAEVLMNCATSHAMLAQRWVGRPSSSSSKADSRSPAATAPLRAPPWSPRALSITRWTAGLQRRAWEAPLEENESRDCCGGKQKDPNHEIYETHEKNQRKLKQGNHLENRARHASPACRVHRRTCRRLARRASEGNRLIHVATGIGVPFGKLEKEISQPTARQDGDTAANGPIQS